MTARKKLVSAICIISLVLAITAGVLLSVGAQSNGDNYVGGSVNLVNTGVNINANSSTMGGGADKPAEAPADAVAISDATELQNFLSSSETYGYLTADIVFNASGVGSSVGLRKAELSTATDGRLRFKTTMAQLPTTVIVLELWAVWITVCS